MKPHRNAQHANVEPATLESMHARTCEQTSTKGFVGELISDIILRKQIACVMQESRDRQGRKH